MLNFKIKQLDNISFEFEELKNYYFELKTNYQHLKWEIDPNLNFGTVFSWAIQSNLADTNQPTPPYILPNEWLTDAQRDIDNIKFDTHTSLVFGFAKKILDTFPLAKQTVIIGHGSGFIVPPHIDEEHILDEEHLKIHVPIESSNRSYFEIENEKFTLKPGKFYLVNTTLMHSTINLDTNDRVHLIFKVPVSGIENLISNNIVI